MELRWLLFGILLRAVSAFCPSGCTCSNETRNVICDNIRVDSIPVFLNPALIRLSLKNSHVKLDRDSIRLYRDLEYLDLSNNDIGEFPPGFFDQLANLRVLHLSGNKITKIETDLFINLEKLESLDVSQNEIEQIESNAFDALGTLKLLNLSTNRLQFIEPIYKVMAHLKVLDISRNEIKTIASGSFNELRSLQELYLSDNSIGYLHPKIFAHQNQLLQLNLQGNRLEEIQRNVFDGLFVLNLLNLSRNALKSIDTSNWPKLDKLIALDLSHNPSISLDSSPFKGMGLLRSLRLNSIDNLNEIKNNSFDGLYKLEEISISNCPRLSKIHPYAFVENTKLQSVDLSLNLLETLSAETLRWEMLDYLDLSGNPWVCNCSLLSFLPGVLRRIKRSGNRAVCVQPEQMLGVELSNAKSSLCSTTNNYTLLLLGAAVFLTLLIVLVLLVFCIRSVFCCWRPNQKLKNNKNGRAPLYAPTSSSFSDSLIYDKQHDPSATMVVTCEPSGRSITSSNSLNCPHFRPYLCYQQNEPTDYYSSIPLPPPQFETYHHHFPRSNGYATCLPEMFHPISNNYGQYSEEASPYAVGQSRIMRPPSFIAPPPPPSIPPPKLAYRYVD